MKILHTSDWHLGATDQNTSLYDDQEFFINQICEVIDKEQVDVVVIAGDIYDRALASADAIRLYDLAMNRICVELGKKVICIAGNHDNSNRLASCNALLEKAGLYVLGALEREPSVVSIGDTDFYLLPWFTEEKVKTLYPEERENIKDITAAYQLVCDRCRESFVEGRRHVAVSHAFITNAETSTSDKAAVIGFATQVPASVFEGFDYVALGHIHKPQQVSNNARYSGTPMPYSFGAEEKQEKSVTILDTEDLTTSVVSLPLLNKRTTISGTFEEIMSVPCTEEERTGYVRIEVTDQYLGLELVSKLMAVYPRIISFSGKTFENENGGISMTMEEFRELESDPSAIFQGFCRDIFGEETKSRWLELFLESVEEVEA